MDKTQTTEQANLTKQLYCFRYKKATTKAIETKAKDTNNKKNTKTKTKQINY